MGTVQVLVEAKQALLAKAVDSLGTQEGRYLTRVAARVAREVIELRAMLARFPEPSETEQVFDSGPDGDDELTCGLCHKRLSECKIGPCPWGSPVHPARLELPDGRGGDLVECLLDTGEVPSCDECRYGLQDVCVTGGTLYF